MIIPFGKKHYGEDATDVFLSDPDYIRWLLDAADHWWVDENREELEALFKPKSDIRGDYTLSDSQRSASETSIEQLFEKGKRVVRIQGGAGYGKSFVTLDVALEAIDRGYRVTGIATSYVASQELAKSLSKANCKAGTIARTLSLAPVYSGKKERYEETSKTWDSLDKLFGGLSLVIIDEYSMVEDSIARLLRQGLVENPNSRLLIVGDIYQLPSPAQTTPSILNNATPEVTLTEPMRYAPGSPLHKLETIARFNPGQIRSSISSLEDRESIFIHGDSDSLKTEIATVSDVKDESSIMLFFRRDAMSAANLDIRNIIYGSNEDQLVEGEVVRIQKTSKLPKTGSDTDFPGMIYSGQHVQLRDVEKERHSTHINIGAKVVVSEGEYWTATILTNTGEHRVPLIFSSKEDRASPDYLGSDHYNELMSEVAKACQEQETWAAYHEVKNNFVQIAYSYATTVHRAQGATFDNVFLSLKEIENAPPYMRRNIVYVALTRARKSLHIAL